MHYHVQLYTHRRRLSGQPGHVPPIIEKRPCIYHFYHRLPPIFLTSLRQCVHVTLRAGLSHITFGNCIFFTFPCSSPVFLILLPPGWLQLVAFAPVARLIASPKTIRSLN